MPLDKDIRERLSKQTGDIKAKDPMYFERNSKFDINVQQYPSDLGAQDLLHYIEFGINVRGRSEVDKTKRLFEVKRDPDAAGMTEEELSTVTTLGAAAVGGVVGYGITSSIVGLVEKTGAKNLTSAQKTAIKAAGAVGGTIAGATVTKANDLLKPDTSYRISDVIALYVDGPPTVRYNMNYANKDLGTLAGIIKGGVGETLKVLGPTSEQFAAAFNAFAKLPGAFGTLDVQAALSASTKTALNPFREVIFESVDFRAFSFKYKFLPKSKEESEKVRNIIKLFKYHMHPEMSKSKLFFIYPSEFQITYYFQSAENSYIHKFAPCVLETMEVSYGGEQFSSFDDGNPTEVNMALTFRETEILTKKMIDKGY